jgi:hypothetical protein
LDVPFDNRVAVVQITAGSSLVTFAAGDSLVPFAAEERRFAFAAGRNLMVEEFAADMGQVVAFVDNPYHLDIK